MKVACYVPKYRDEEPQIGVIKSLMEGGEKIEIEWMVGGYSECWEMCKIKKGKEYVPWSETIFVKNILFPVELTKSKR